MWIIKVEFDGSGEQGGSSQSAYIDDSRISIYLYFSYFVDHWCCICVAVTVLPDSTDHAPRPHGQGDVPLAEWWVYMPCDPGVQGPNLSGPSANLPQLKKLLMTAGHTAGETLQVAFIFPY